MDLAEARAFVRGNHWGVLATYRADGRPQLSPVTASTDGAGNIIVSSRETAFKVRNLRRDPRASYCGFTEAFFGPWTQVDGTASIVSLPEAMDGLVAYYRSVSGEHPDWDDYRAAMERERRVLVVITPERAGPNRSG
ncbi:MAG TPA: PPOX class F420-dependent oxidoreductase [Mycobacteriales bacterium]|nr:PPOX class F420-dependent oxidoreductase [Mycobacteriales bacterium]